MIEHFYKDIPGWFDFENIYSRMVNEAKDGDVFIEIGTANGQSAAFMCVEIANSGKDIEFYTVDIFPAENEQWNQEKNVREWLKPFPFAHVVKSDSVEFLKQFDKQCQFIFLDGKHEVDPLLFELFLAFEIVKKGGYIGGHDLWNPYPGVQKSVEMFCHFTGLKPEIDNISYLIKK